MFHNQYEDLQRLSASAAAEQFRQDCEESGLLTVPEVARSLNRSADYMYRYLKFNRWLYRQAGGWRGYRVRIHDQVVVEQYLEYLDEQGEYKQIFEPMLTWKGRTILAALIRPPLPKGARTPTPELETCGASRDRDLIRTRG